MDPTIVDFVSDPPRLGFPDGSWCPTTRNQARIEARRLLFGESLTGALDVPVGSPVASGCGDGTGTGGEARTPHGESPSRPISPWVLFQTPCRPGQCEVCDDRRERQWQYMEDC
jgi:hypothetical protein